METVESNKGDGNMMGVAFIILSSIMKFSWMLIASLLAAIWLVIVKPAIWLVKFAATLACMVPYFLILAALWTLVLTSSGQTKAIFTALFDIAVGRRGVIATAAQKRQAIKERVKPLEGYKRLMAQREYNRMKRIQF